MRSALLYTLARIGVFLVVLLIFSLFGDLTLITVVMAIIVSALVSYLVLGPLRDQLVARLVARSERRREARSQRVTDEDIEDSAS